MTKDKPGYTKATLLSVLMHVLIMGFLLVEISRPAKMYTVPAKQVSHVVNAETVDSQQLQNTIAQIQQQEQAKQQAAARQLAEAKKARQAQQQAAESLAKLKQQQQAAEKALAKKQQAIAQAKQQLEQQQAQIAAEKAKAQAAEKARLAKEKQRKKLAEEIAEADAALRARQIQAEQEAIKKAQATQLANAEINKYKAQIIQAISQNWIVPNQASPNLKCELQVKIAPGGVVTNVSVLKSSGDTGLDNSAVSAVYKASPLPVPSDPTLFKSFRELNLTVRPLNLLNAS